jgi:hypothetical protein
MSRFSQSALTTPFRRRRLPIRSRSRSRSSATIQICRSFGVTAALSLIPAIQTGRLHGGRSSSWINKGSCRGGGLPRTQKSFPANRS